MRSVSNYYKDKIRSGDTRNFLIKIELTLADDTEITVTESDILAGSFKILSACSGDSSFDIGSTIIGKCEFSLVNFDDRYVQFDFFNATAVVWVKLDGDNEYHRIGFYTVDEPTYAGSIIQIEMLDNMWLFDVPLADVGISVPITLANAVSAVCSHCGVTLATNTFHGYSFQLTALPEQDMNCREFLQYVAMIGCNFCVIDSQGQLRLRWYNTPSISEDSLDGGSFLTSTTPYSDGDDADGGNFTDYSSGDDYDGGSFVGENIPYFTRLFTRNLVTDEITITGVKIVIEDTEYSIGTTGYVLVLENPLVTASNVNNVLNLIWDVLEDFKLRGFKVTALPDIAPEVGDCVAVSYKGNMIYTYLSSFEFTPSACTAALGCEAPTRNLQRRYSKSTQTAVEQAKKKTNEIISEYDNLVQLMNSIAVNAIGGYEDYEDLTTGGRVWYVSNRPITKVNNVCSFVAGSTVFKKTGEGFYVSTDGGQNYVNGYDAQTGLLVVNILSAIGVVANWIRTGEISDSLNYNYWNLDTGEFRLTQGAKVRYDQTDYSGAYVPTLSNSPASSWNTTALNEPNVGKTFKDTSTGKDYIYMKGVLNYPKTSHPYGNREDKVYKIITGLDNATRIKITFNSQCSVESGYDYVIVGRFINDLFHGIKLDGNFGGQSVVIENEPFYIVWHSDVSNTDWGWAIDSIAETTDTISTLLNYTFPSITETVVSPYYWDEVTLEEFTKSISKVAVDENMTQEEIFNALTNGGQEQGIYLNNGKVYLNGQYVKADSISANDIATGRMRADMIQGGTLTLGGTDDFNGNLIVLGNNTTLDSEEDVTTASHDYGYYDFGSLGKYVVSASLSGLQNDYTMVFEVGLTTNGGLDYHIIFREEFTFNKPSVVFTLPVVLDINTTDRDTYYHIGVHEKTWTKTFNYEYSYSPVSVLLDKTGIDAISGSIGDMSLENGEIFTRGTYYFVDRDKKITVDKKTAKEATLVTFKPYKLYIKESSFKVTINYSFSASTTRTVNIYTQTYSSGSWVTVNTDTITHPSAGSGVIELSRTFYNDETTKYRIRFYASALNPKDTFQFTYRVSLNNITIASLSADGIWGNFFGSLSGRADLDSASIGDVDIAGTELYASEPDSDDYMALSPSRLYGTNGVSSFLFSNNGVDCHNSDDTKNILVSHDELYLKQDSSNTISLTTRGLICNYYSSGDTSKCKFTPWEISSLYQGSTYSIPWSLSDRRFKEEIEDLDVELSKNLIDASQPKKFKIINRDGTHYGMIAQEVREVLDDLGEKDAALEYVINSEDSAVSDPRNINYTEYIPHLINYVKDLRAELDRVKTELNRVKTELKEGK